MSWERILPGSTGPHRPDVWSSFRRQSPSFQGGAFIEKLIQSPSRRAGAEKLLFASRESQLLNSIAHDPEPQSYFESLFGFASELERSGQLEQAALVYSELSRTTGPEFFGNEMNEPNQALLKAFQSTATHRLEVLQGKGSGGEHTEFLLRELPRRLIAPEGLIAMSAAGAAFHLARFRVLGGLLGSPTANILTRGLGAECLAGGAAWLAEATAFTLAGRGIADVFGRGSATSFGQDLASNALVFGGLRLAASSSAWVRIPGLGANAENLRALQHQTAMFGGILAGHGLQSVAGVDRTASGDHWLIDSLATWMQFNVSDRLMRGYLPGWMITPRVEPSAPRKSFHWQVLQPHIFQASLSIAEGKFFPQHSQMSMPSQKDLSTIRPPIYSEEVVIETNRREFGAPLGKTSGDLPLITPGQPLTVLDIWQLSEVIKAQRQEMIAALEAGSLHVQFPADYSNAETLRVQAVNLASLFSLHSRDATIFGRKIILEVPASATRDKFSYVLVNGSNGFELPDPKETQSFRQTLTNGTESPTATGRRRKVGRFSIAEIEKAIQTRAASDEPSPPSSGSVARTTARITGRHSPATPSPETPKPESPRPFVGNIYGESKHPMKRRGIFKLSDVDAVLPPPSPAPEPTPENPGLFSAVLSKLGLIQEVQSRGQQRRQFAQSVAQLRFQLSRNLTRIKEEPGKPWHIILDGVFELATVENYFAQHFTLLATSIGLSVPLGKKVGVTIQTENGYVRYSFTKDERGFSGTPQK